MGNSELFLKFIKSRILFPTFGILFISACDSPTSSATNEVVKPTPVTSSEIVSENLSAENNKVDKETLGDAEKSALELFAYQQGEWDCEWIMYDATGQETGRFQGHQSVQPSFDEYSQVTTTVIPEIGYEGHSLRAFNPVEGKIVSLVVGPRGDYWELSQDPLTGVTTSKMHKGADGSLTSRRFTRSTLGNTGYKVFMEVSYDRDEIWHRRFEQRLTRRVD